MLYFVYWERQYVGTVIAATEDEARLRADEKFGPFLGGVVEVKPRLPQPSTCTRSGSHKVAS